MKSLCNSLALAGALLDSSAHLVDARLGSENDNADSASNERKLQTSQLRRLDLLNKMFSGMVEGAGAITTQLDQYIGDNTDLSSEFDLSSLMDLLGDSGSFGDMSSMMEAMMNPVNFTDIFNRCCASDATIIGATEYDNTSTESCDCPVRNAAPFEAKWDDKCLTSVGPKALAEINGEAELKTGMELFMEAMADKDMDKGMDFSGMMDGGGDFDFSGMMDGGFGDAFGDMMESIFGPVNYTDVQNRCCSDGGSSAYDLDPSSCACPVRNNTKYLAKWDEQCTTKIAMKAAEQQAGGGSSATAETDGSGAFDLGSMMDGMDMDLESFFESLFGKSVNYTQVYDNCCETAEGFFDTAYSTIGTSSCKCPVRQSNPKWETACADKIVPKLTEA